MVQRLGALLLLTLTCACTAAVVPQQRPTTAREVNTNFRAVLEAVVGLTAEDGRIFCSGVALEGGKILTAQHCVEDSSKTFNVGFYNDYSYDKMKFTAFYSHRVVKSDAANDLAVLEPATPESLPAHGYLTIAQRDPMIGERVFAFGHPRGIGYFFTEGRVTVPGMHNSGTVGSKGEDYFFMFSAPIARGNSGGPLLNADGEILGIVRFIAYEQAHLAGAVHTSVVRSFL